MSDRRCSPIVLFFLLVLTCSHAISQGIPVHGNGLDVDLNGVLYVLDSDHSMLRQYSPEGKLIRELGGAGWQNDQFDHPEGIWAHNGVDVFVADYGNHRIQRFDKNLAFISTFFTRDNSNPDERFGYPSSVSVSRLGELFICDTENSRIVKVGNSNTVEKTFGGFGAGMGNLRKPSIVACGPNDEVCVLDPPRVMVYDAFGNFLGELFEGGFTQPRGLSADQQSIAVLDSGSVMIFDGAHRLVQRLVLPVTDGHMEQPECVSLSREHIYVLSPSGLSVYPNPRYRESQPRLEKEQDSH